MNTASTVHVSPVTTQTGLFRWYDGQHEPQPCYLQLDLEDGELTCGYNPELSNAVTSSVAHRRTLTFSIPCLTAEAANQLMAEALPIAQRILDGASIEWNGNVHVGILNEDAVAAEDELADLTEQHRNDPGADLVSGVFPGEWYGDKETAASANNITADTTDNDIATITQRAEKDIEHVAEGAVVVIGLDKYLWRVREELRAEVRDELENVADSVTTLTEKRNDLVRRVAAWGVDSDRAIGALVGKSHTWVQKVVAG